MKEQKRNIDELFLEELGNATEVPPSSVWTTLETQLDSPGNTGSTGNLGRFKTWWLVWSLVVLISGSVTGYMVLNKPKSDALKTIPGKELPAPVREMRNEGAADTSGNTIPGSSNDSNNTREDYNDKDVPSGVDKPSRYSQPAKKVHDAVRGGTTTSSLSSNVATASGHKRGASGPAGGAIKTYGITNGRHSSVDRTTGALAANPDTHKGNDAGREQLSAADHDAASIASTRNRSVKGNNRTSASGLSARVDKDNPGTQPAVTRANTTGHSAVSNSSVSGNTGKKTDKSSGNPGYGTSGKNLGSVSSVQTTPVTTSIHATGNSAGKDNSQPSGSGLSDRAGKDNPGKHAAVTKTANTTGHSVVSNNSGSSSTGKKTDKFSGDPGPGTGGKNLGAASSVQITPVTTSIASTGNRTGKGNSRSSISGLSAHAGKDNPGEHTIVTKIASTAGHTAISNSSVRSAAGKKTNKSSGYPGSGTRGRNMGSVSSVQKASAATSISTVINPAKHTAVVNSKNTTERPTGQSLDEPAASRARAVAIGAATMSRKSGAANTNETKNGRHAAGEENTPLGKAITDVVSSAKGSAGKPVAATEKKQAPAVQTGQRESPKVAGPLPVGVKDNNMLLIDTDKMNSEDDGTDEPYLPVVAVPKAALSKMNVTEDQPGRPGVAPVSHPVATVVQQAAAQPTVTAPKLRSDVPDFLKVSQQGGAGGGGGSDDAAAKKTKKKGPRRSDFEGGIKLGYEVGAAAFTSGKFVASFYAQYNLDERLGLVIQPAIKIATTNRKLETPQGNYYSVTRPTDVVLYSIDTPIGGSKTSSFAYSQTYDSMIASVVSQQKYAEIDLPLMLRYQLSKNFSIMGGINITLGKIINLNSSVRTISGLTLRDTISGIADTMAPAPASKFDHRSSVPFSSYAAAEALNAANNPIRFGYTVSMSYVIRDRIMIDFLMQQTTSNLNYIPNREIRKLYSQPYMRFTVGYKLFGGRKQVRDK